MWTENRENSAPLALETSVPADYRYRQWDSNPHSSYPERDFKSLASAISPCRPPQETIRPDAQAESNRSIQKSPFQLKKPASYPVAPEISTESPRICKISLRPYPHVCYTAPPMSIAKKPAFSRRLPDLVTEELASALSRRSAYEFKDLFDVVHENLKARNAASGGEEMLRLRAYEKLQNLVSRGMVKITVGKDGKKSYKGLPKQLATLQTNVTPAI